MISINAVVFLCKKYVKKKYTVITTIITSSYGAHGDIAMHKNSYVFLSGTSVMILYAMCAYSAEYIYPLTQYVDNGQEVLLFMYQTSTQDTRLWSLNSTTNYYEQLLSSQYNPVGVQLLPDNSGFSFLDNGLIKVKNFLKRSPKTIEIYEPICNIGTVQWLDATTCFFHAKQGNRYGIYQVNLDGQLAVIIKNSSCDYLYPQKIGADLFFIRRDISGNHCVEKIIYPQFKNVPISLDEAMDRAQEEFEYVDTAVINIQNLKKINVINISMRNAHEGFFVEHVPMKSTSESALSFVLYTFVCDAHGEWNTKKLFLFSLPTSLFFDNATMLRDPMQVLFPRITSEGIYFISLQENVTTLCLYFYDTYSDFVTPCKTYSFFPASKSMLTHDTYAHVLMPIMTKQGLLCGYAR